jgi:peptidoglycan/LPS O-acetylase OafA/YrhL
MLTNIYNKFRRITTNQLYFPEIDGIRFLAITLVVLFHTHGYFIKKTSLHFTDSPGNYSWLEQFLSNGDRGVPLFFVLSGFILCLPFAHHYINHGKKVSLKKYYLRRVTRLEPPYFIAMTAIFLIQLVMHVKPFAVLFPSWAASLVYAHDIIFHHVPLITVVAWSLEIEIQFYLLAPFLFWLLALQKSTRRLILCVAILSFITMQHIYMPPFLNIYQFAQYFLTGILLADIYVSGEAISFFNKPIIIPLAFISLVTVCYLPIYSSFYTALLFPFLIGLFYYMVLKNDVIKSIFSYKFIPVIGGMCYSIYLLHYTIISILGRFTVSLTITNYYLPNLILQVILLGIPVLIVSAVFYYYIEQPFMSRKWLDMLMKKDKKEEEANATSDVG